MPQKQTAVEATRAEPEQKIPYLYERAYDALTIAPLRSALENEVANRGEEIRDLLITLYDFVQKMEALICLVVQMQDMNNAFIFQNMGCI